jgi:hypothetical protein
LKKVYVVASLAVSLLSSPLVATAGVISLYDIDFSSPTHTVGSTPSVGTGSDQVSFIRFGDPTVIDTSAGTPDQALHFTAQTGAYIPYQQIELTMGRGYDNYQMSFDMVASNLVGSNYEFVLLADTPSVRNLYFRNTGDISLIGKNMGTFANDTSYNVMLDYDLVDQQVSYWMNGVLVGSQLFTTSGGDIESFRFNLGPYVLSQEILELGPDTSVWVNLDNIKVTTRTADPVSAVPEPSAIMLMMLGMGGLGSFRAMKGRNAKKLG